MYPGKYFWESPRPFASKSKTYNNIVDDRFLIVERDYCRILYILLKFYAAIFIYRRHPSGVTVAPQRIVTSEFQHNTAVVVKLLIFYRADCTRRTKILKFDEIGKTVAVARHVNNIIINIGTKHYITHRGICGIIPSVFDYFFNAGFEIQTIVILRTLKVKRRTRTTQKHIIHNPRAIVKWQFLTL